MFQDGWRLGGVEGLHVQDMLKLVHAFRGVLHVSRQVTVEETQHVAVEGNADRHAPFVTLREQQMVRIPIIDAVMIMD